MEVENLIANIPQKPTVFDLVDGLGGKSLTVQEKVAEPLRQESQRRSHVFHDVAGFVAYVSKYGGDNIVVLCDAMQGRVVATLDEKATKGVEFIQFVPPLHPLWAPWETLLKGGTQPLRSFVEFCALNRKAIHEPDGRDLVILFSQVKASIGIEAHHGTGKDAVNGLLVKTKIEGKERIDATALPDSLVLRVPIFIRTKPVDIEIDLLLNANTGGEVFVSLSCADLVTAKITAFEDLLTQLDPLLVELPKPAIVSLGVLSRSSWDYVK